MLKEAIDKHKKGVVEEAISLYRRVLAAKDDHQVEILLANVLFTSPAPTSLQAVSRKAEAIALADRAYAHSETLDSAKERAMLLARYGYFTLQAHNIHHASDNDDDDEKQPDAVRTADPASPLGKAIAALERAVQLDPAITIAWRNLSMCYKSLGRFDDSERAMRKAVEAAGTRVNADLLYRHAKALIRLKRDGEAAGRYCDVLKVDPTHALSAFWCKVMLASPDKHPGVTPAVCDRMRTAVAAFEAATEAKAAASADGDGASAAVTAAAAVPHEYIRKLFDGYSKRFDTHLVKHLHYRTPAALLALALEAAATHSDRPQQLAHSSSPYPAAAAATVAWEVCGDLGCGTGLAGVEFRPYVGYMSGVDLSGGMVAEARKRGWAPTAAASVSATSAATPLYDALDVDEVEAWLRKQATVIAAAATTAATVEGTDGSAAPAAAKAAELRCESAPRKPYDLLVCADVLVYIGALEGCFSAAAAAMVPTTAAGRSVSTPSLFVLSTESEPEDNDSCSSNSSHPGYRLTGTGRCCHRRSYVIRTAQAAGFRLLLDRRQPIRKNAGEDVMGDLYVFERVG